MAARKAKPTPNSFTFNPLWLKVGVGILVLLVCVLVVCYFEGINRHVQTDRRFSEDPVVASWYQDTKALVGASAGSSSGQIYPVALWYGKVEECRTSNPRSGGKPELLAVKLAQARLMVGEKGKLDKSDTEVIISTRNASVSPRVGEEWLFSVWRDEQGYNHTKSACFYRPKRS
ncbi:MAG: hypothetical protein ACI9R3_000516 [Verrucomicrobiales bacterium]|jgi:hypothetical protein